MPVVKCAIEAIGQPCGGGLPLGTKMTPDTTVADPSIPEVERYRILAARLSTGGSPGERTERVGIFGPKVGVGGPIVGVDRPHRGVAQRSQWAHAMGHDRRDHPVRI